MQSEYLVSFHLTVLSSVIGILAIMLAVLSFFGFYFIKKAVMDGVDEKVKEKLSEAEKEAKKIAREIAKIEVDKRMNEIKNQVLELVEKFPQDDLSLGSPLHSALDSRKNEKMEEVYSDE